MSFPVKLATWCATIAVASVILITRPCFAQENMAEVRGTVKAAALEAEEAEHGSSGPNPLAVDPDLAVWTFVVFVVLFIVLKTFAWPQITVALEEREKRIADNIAAAEAQNAESRRLLAEHEAKLAAAAGEVRALLDEARRDADVTRKRIEAEGQKAAKDELDRAVREIGRARDAAIQELAITSANVAVDLAKGVVKQEISADRQKQIVRDALGKLGAATPSKN
jgi:F-type H+-transporting ATPase subunit b